MYELTCPSCRHVVRAPFVRVGAVVACESCGSRYRVAAEHIVRRAAEGAGTVAEMSAPAAPGEALHVDSSGSMVGLSGLSEMMQREGDAPPAAAPGVAGGSSAATAAIPRASPPTRSHVRRRPALPRSRHPAVEAARRQAWWALAVLPLLLGLLGGVLWFAWKPGHEADGAAGHADGSAGGNAQASVAVLDPDTPIASARRLSPGPWTEPQDPDAAPLADSPPERALTIPASSVLDDIAYVFTQRAERLLTATVYAPHPEIVDEADLHLSLVHMDGRVVARTDQPVTLLNRRHGRTIAVAMPQSLPDGQVSVHGELVVHRVLRSGRWLDGASIEVHGEGRQTMGLIRVPLPPAATSGQLVVLIEGREASGRPAMQWVVRWPVENAPEQRIRLYVPLPRERSAQVDHWSVEAAFGVAPSQDAAPSNDGAPPPEREDATR